MTGKIKDISTSITGEAVVSLAIEESAQHIPGLTELYQAGDRLAVKISKYRRRRSLEANAYHWTLCGKIARACHTDADTIHYRLMLRYGTPLVDDAGRPLTITARADVDMEKCGIYGRLISARADGDTGYYTYMLIKRSRDYDSKEMSDLIDGTVSEAQEMGVETLPPVEIEALKEALRRHEEKQKSKSL